VSSSGLVPFGTHGTVIGPLADPRMACVLMDAKQKFCFEH
jgi:hypothetical protein